LKAKTRTGGSKQNARDPVKKVGYVVVRGKVERSRLRKDRGGAEPNCKKTQY